MNRLSKIDRLVRFDPCTRISAIYTQDMNNAQLKGLQLTHTDYVNARRYEETRLTITKTDKGFEVHRGGKLVGITQTSAGARELAGAL